MDAFDYLLDLSMSISGCETDRAAISEAHEALVAMNDDCGAPAAVATLWGVARPRRSVRAARPLRRVAA
jgi:hypothetical protein